VWAFTCFIDVFIFAATFDDFWISWVTTQSLLWRVSTIVSGCFCEQAEQMNLILQGVQDLFFVTSQSLLSLHTWLRLETYSSNQGGLGGQGA